MSIETDLDMFVAGKGDELCDEIASKLGIDKPDDGWSDDLIVTMEVELMYQIHNDSEAIFENWAMNHGAACCEAAFNDKYEPEEVAS